MPGTISIDDTVRRAADVLEAASTGHFRARIAGDRSGAGEPLVRRAVDRARDGDVDALRYLYLQYSDTVFSYVSSILGDKHAAEDITQTVFSRLSIRLQRYKGGDAPFGTWLRRVAHNAAIDHIRAQRLVPSEDVLDTAVSREDVSPDRSGALREALATLPSDQREVLVLRFVLGLAAHEIGKRLGRTEPAVHALQHKGRRRLRQELVRLQAAPSVQVAA